MHRFVTVSFVAGPCFVVITPSIPGSKSGPAISATMRHRTAATWIVTKRYTTIAWKRCSSRKHLRRLTLQASLRLPRTAAAAAHLPKRVSQKKQSPTGAISPWLTQYSLVCSLDRRRRFKVKCSTGSTIRLSIPTSPPASDNWITFRTSDSSCSRLPIEAILFSV